MKQTCKCGTVIEVDERKYAPGTIVHQECPLCGNMVEFKIPDAAKEEAKRLQKEQDANDKQRELEARLHKLQEQLERQQRQLQEQENKAALVQPIPKPPTPAPTSPAPSELISEPFQYKLQPAQPQQHVTDTSSGSNGLLGIIIAVFAIIAILAFVVINAGTGKRVEMPTANERVTDSVAADEVPMSSSVEEKSRNKEEAVEDDASETKEKHDKHSKKDSDEENHEDSEENYSSEEEIYNSGSAYSSGTYTLSGTLSKGSFCSPVEISFSSDGTSLSDCEYTNLRADDGSCNMSISETRNGGLSLAGYDNQGTYFTISVKKRGNTYKGIANVGKRKWNVNLTLQ